MYSVCPCIACIVDGLICLSFSNMVKGEGILLYFGQNCSNIFKNPFAKLKLLLEHQEENIKRFSQGKTSYKQFLATSPQYTGRT